MLKYTTFATEFGHVSIFVSSRGLARIVMSSRPFAQGLHAPGPRLRMGSAGSQIAIGRRGSNRKREQTSDLIEDNDGLAQFAEPLKTYFSGKPIEFDLDLDLSAVTPFQKRVLEECARIPYGQTATYGELARRIGRPTAARAVGHAMARNPIPIVIPCHRVLASNGSLCGFSAEQGIALKQRLLSMEETTAQVCYADCGAA